MLVEVILIRQLMVEFCAQNMSDAVMRKHSTKFALAMVFWSFGVHQPRHDVNECGVTQLSLSLS